MIQIAREMMEDLKACSGSSELPQVFINQKFIGSLQKVNSAKNPLHKHYVLHKQSSPEKNPLKKHLTPQTIRSVIVLPRKNFTLHEFDTTNILLRKQSSL